MNTDILRCKQDDFFTGACRHLSAANMQQTPGEAFFAIGWKVFWLAI